MEDTFTRRREFLHAGTVLSCVDTVSWASSSKRWHQKLGGIMAMSSAMTIGVAKVASMSTVCLVTDCGAAAACSYYECCVYVVCVCCVTHIQLLSNTIQMKSM